MTHSRDTLIGLEIALLLVTEAFSEKEAKMSSMRFTALTTFFTILMSIGSERILAHGKGHAHHTKTSQDSAEAPAPEPLSSRTIIENLEIQIRHLESDLSHGEMERVHAYAERMESLAEALAERLPNLEGSNKAKAAGYLRNLDKLIRRVHRDDGNLEAARIQVGRLKAQFNLLARQFGHQGKHKD